MARHAILAPGIVAQPRRGFCFGPRQQKFDQITYDFLSVQRQLLNEFG